MATPTSKKRNKMTLCGDPAMYRNLIQNMEEVKSMFASQGHRYSSLEILNFAMGKMNTNKVKDIHSMSKSVECDRNSADENLVTTTVSAMENLLKIAGSHGSLCEKPMNLKLVKQHGCSSEFQVICSFCSFTSAWVSSPILPDGRDLINLRITHAYLSSGLLPSQLQRFLEASGLDTLPYTHNSANVNEYAGCVEEERKMSCASALQKEIQITRNNGIDIITDARHSTRRNSKYTDVVCIGYDSHKVIEHVVVRREDDSCSQRHELYGT